MGIRGKGWGFLLAVEEVQEDSGGEGLPAVDIQRTQHFPGLKDLKGPKISTVQLRHKSNQNMPILA